MDHSLPPPLQALCAKAENIATELLLENADRIDQDAAWPEQNMRALQQAGLTGLQVDQRYGGHGQGMLGLAAVTRVLGRACASTAMCFGMHCVASAVIGAKATKTQVDRYLRPIAAGEHLTTLALSEAGTGSYFFMPETKLGDHGDHYLVDGTKHFVTNGAHVDSYVISTRVSRDSAPGEFNCLVVDGGTEGITWMDGWKGFGMRGNSSRSMQITAARVPKENLLGEEGDQVWYVFEVVAPFFLTAMAGTYLGVAEAALAEATTHLKTRRHSHSGEALAQLPTLQHRLAELWTAVQKTRLLLLQAARLGDLGSPDALPSILACKLDAAETAVFVTNEAMTLCGGNAYRDNSILARLLRDARASHVMSPTTEMLKLWLGRTVLGLPLL